MSDDPIERPITDPESEGLPVTADDDSTADDPAPSGRAADGPSPAALPADHPIASTDYGTTPAEARTPEPLDDRLAREVPDPYASASGSDPYSAAPDTTPYAARPGDDSSAPEPGPDPYTAGTDVDHTAADPDLAAAASPEDPKRTDPAPPLDQTAPAASEVDTGDPFTAPSTDRGPGPVELASADTAAAGEDQPPTSPAADPAEAEFERADLPPDSDLGELGADPDSRTSTDDQPTVDPDQAGRLVAPDEGAHPDQEPTEVAKDPGLAGGGLTAEESAMHEESP